ncbi:EamA/RhaT family transporter [Bacillus timonensis]|nr:EamA/RhaT family transporter [Bacillus timonensis]
MESNLKEKKKPPYLGIMLMIIASLCTATGQFFWKLSLGHFNVELIVGFTLYFLGAVFMIVAFRNGKLSVLHPFLSIGYIISTIIGVTVLEEQFNYYTIAGIASIIIGVILIGGESD